MKSKIMYIPLFFHEFLHLNALKFHLAFTFMVKNFLIWSFVEALVEFLQLLLGFIIHLVLLSFDEGEITLDVTVGAATTRRHQPYAVIHADYVELLSSTSIL